MGTELRTVRTAGREITYGLTRKRVKNLNLRVRPDGTVAVSASPLVPAAEVDAFVIRKGELVLRAMARAQEKGEEQPQPHRFVTGETFRILDREVELQVVRGKSNGAALVENRLELQVKNPEDEALRRRTAEKYFNGLCMDIFTKILEEQLPLLAPWGVAKPALRIRNMTSRWGSCMYRRGIVTLNKRLLSAPRVCVEYVALHELCHFVHPDHSPAFHALMTRLMPDWRERKAALNRSCCTWL